VALCGDRQQIVALAAHKPDMLGQSLFLGVAIDGRRVWIAGASGDAQVPPPVGVQLAAQLIPLLVRWRSREHEEPAQAQGQQER
jgi:hypothetical protein